MAFEAKRTDLAGRIGRLVTNHGVLETPYLFPVVDPARQVPNLSKLEELGFNGIITNAYLFYKRNLGQVRSIHAELDWKKVIMTDSGGYQILVYGGVEVDNKTIVQYEKEIGSDIAVILDVPTGSKMTRDEAERAVYETYKRGLEALPLIEDAKQLWVYPIQGAPYLELVARSAILARKLPYDIYAVGSPTVMLEKYEYSKLVEIVAIAKMHLPPGRPLHVFGVGHPMVIPFLVAIGGDLFDSASYILYARDGRYMTEAGTRNIREMSYFPCSCPVCSKYTPQELLEMPDNKRTELLALHNLYVLAKEIRTVKQHIREGRLWELLEYRSRSHPALFEAFNKLKKYYRLLAKYSPLTNPGGRAVFIYPNTHLYNPRLRVNIERAEKTALRDLKDKIVVIIPAYRKPYNKQEEYIKASTKAAGSEVKVLIIHPQLGLLTAGTSSTYPFYQHEGRIWKESMDPQRLAALIEKVAKRKPRLVILVKAAWLSNKVAGRVSEVLKSRGVETVICKLDEISSLLPR